jgi:intein-encoded DNA endonuclease-like protein
MRRKEYNQNYFENIDSEDKAYFLGFIYADGSLITDKRNSLYIKVHTKDSHIIETFINCINGEMIPWKSKSRDIIQVSVSGKKIIDDLLKIGLHQNKTFTLKYPKIPIELERHFIRGFFDGDGCIRVKTDSRDGAKVGDMRFVCGSIDMLNTINERMNFLFGAKKNLLYGSNKNYKYLGWGAMSDIERIYSGFYQDSNFYLKRKKETFDEVLSIIKDKIKYRKRK